MLCRCQLTVVNAGRIAMGIRPRSKFVKQVKARVCPKCGAKLNTQVTRCRRCHATQTKPKK
jgi:ribosomal protein L40E